MEQWEYLTEFHQAHVGNQGWEEYSKNARPGSQLPKYAPETMIPGLNRRGEDGWELVHMEPVAATGKNGDVGFGRGTPTMHIWSNTYFCVFKRRKQAF